MTITLAPSKNAAIIGSRRCQFGGDCDNPAVADAQLRRYKSWCYLCSAHLRTDGTLNPALITNITAEPLTLDYLSTPAPSSDTIKLSGNFVSPMTDFDPDDIMGRLFGRDPH